MNFFSIIKPGIIFGNIITVSGGFFLASHIVEPSLSLYFFVLMGMSLVMASGCVFNNIIDRDIDGLMERTKDRVLVKGLLSTKIAFVYATLLGLLGLVVLLMTTNLLTASIAVAGWFIYVFLYSLWFKRHSVYGTAIGGLAGAVPPVVGYCALSHQFDRGALIVFLLLFLWQIPHSYAIAIYRRQDYLNANIPVLPLKKGITITKMVMLLFVILCMIVGLMPSLLGYTAYLYFIISLILGIVWLLTAIHGFYHHNHRHWARKMFLFSILYVSLLSVLMIV